MKKFWVLVLVLLGVAAGTAPTASERFATLRKQAAAARESGDSRARLQAISEMQAFLHRSPEIVKASAKAYAAMGDNDHAIDAWEEFAGMGQSDEEVLAGKEESSKKLRVLPRFQAVLEKLKKNAAPIEKAETAFTLSDSDLLAEDIDYDSGSHSFFLTSVLEKKIVRIDATGKQFEFASSPSGWPMLAVKIDEQRNVVWATEVALDGVEFVAKADWGKSAVLCFDLKNGKLVHRYEGPPQTALGDFVLGSNGDPVVSDSAGGGLYELADGAVRAVNREDFVSPQTATVDGDRIFVPDYARGIGVINTKTQETKWLGGRFALSGIDGLYFVHGTLFATQNGTTPERVVRFRLNSQETEVVSEEVIEQATKTLGDPTHGVQVGNDFYYIANSGWNYLDEHGAVKPGVQREPPRVMKYRMP